MTTVEIMKTSPHLSRKLYETLAASIQGEVYPDDDPNFFEYSKMFNGNVQTAAKAVACPLDAEDVSKIILFCSKHGFSPSVKAGGYGTAGWAVGGDIIIDLSKIVDVDIETPSADGSYTSLRDMVTDKGKRKAGLPVADYAAPNSGKRRREDDALLRTYEAASMALANFLAGPPLPPNSSDVSRPYPVHRPLARSAPGQSPQTVSTDPRSERLLSDSNFGAESNRCSVPTVTAPVTSAPQPAQHSSSNPDPFGYLDSPRPTDRRPNRAGTSVPSTRRPAQVTESRDSDPFGYLNSVSSSPTAAPSSVVPVPSTAETWGSGLATLYPNPFLPAAPRNPLTHTAPVHSCAYVSFGAGMRQKEIDRFTASNPIEGTSLSGEPAMIPYHIPLSAHPVGSSIMLLGGFGFLSRSRGLSIDNLVEVEMVLSDGRIVIVNEEEHPDLWWALRGGGPAFGVATRYKARAYPVPVVFAGNLVYCFRRATAPSLIKHFRDCVKNAPRELYANVLLTAGPEDKDSLIVIQLCYVGSKEKGQEHLAAISSWEGERCLLNEVDEKSFLNQQDSVAQVLRGKAGRQWFIRSTLITSLPDDIINQTVMQFADTPIGCTWLFELAGGAIASFENTSVPKSQREASFTVAALHQWEMGTDDPRCVESAENWISGTLKPVTTGGPFPSFLGRHESAERTIASFGDNWDRLCEIKRKYDPACLFKSTFWPLDVHGSVMEPEMHEPASPQ